MAKNCCWNCRFYIVRGDNEPVILASSMSNVCTFSEDPDEARDWHERAHPTPPGYVCQHYEERFY